MFPDKNALDGSTGMETDLSAATAATIVAVQSDSFAVKKSHGYFAGV